MATLEKIRSKGGVVVAIFIGFALFAFIMTDLMSSGNSMFSQASNDVASINGTSVSIQEFQNKVNEMEEFNKLNRNTSTLTDEEVYQLREQTWNQLINQTLLGEKYEKIGITVTSDELLDMVAGKNVHPFLLQHPLFADPKTGVYDQNQALNIIRSKNSDPTLAFYWKVLEEQLINERLFTKYKNLVKKGMFIPSAWVKEESEARSNSVDFDYAFVRWFAISDSLVKVSDAEIKKYHKENQKNFKQEESRDIEYVTFEILPTEADKQLTLEAIEKMQIDFSKPEVDAIQFVNLNSDEPYLGLNQKSSEFNFGLEGFLANAAINEVYGPYFEEESFKVSRVVAINQVPDSVKARHILIRENSPEASNSMADSLLKLINSGGKFDELARKHSIDQGSALNGGDLGWFTEGRMVKPFNDACFSANKGDVVKVESQFGIHIINVQELSKTSTKYQVATLARKISYSSKTFQEVYSNATRFAALNNDVEKFNKAITAENLTKRFGRGLKKNDNNVSNLESSRELVRWAFESEVNSLSPVFEFGSQFVVALVSNANEEGFMSLEMAKPQIERELINNKKADLIIERFAKAMEGETSLSAIALKMNTTVQNAQNISFGSSQVSGAGFEPALVALAVNTPANKLSKPIKGNNGVFVVKVNSVENVAVQEEMVRQELARSIDMSIDYQLLEALKEKAEIKDNRALFY